MTRKYQNNIEQLVASYASVGRRHQRNRLYTLIAAAAIVPLLMFAGLQTWQFGSNQIVDQRDAFSEQAQEIQAIKESLAVEIEAIHAQRREFEQSRGLLLEQSELLEREIAQAGKQRHKLELQRDEFSGQQQQMSQAIDELEDRRSEIQKQKVALNPLLEQERAAMNAERQKLERQRQRFAEEGALLELEIQAINVQRTELAAQRMTVERRRKELQLLLEKSKNIRNTTTTNESDNRLQEQSAQGAEPLQREPEIVAYAAPTPTSPLGLPYIEAIELEKMRGGFSIGEDMEISIGITRSASINGVEQFSNSLNIADSIGGISIAEMDGVSATLIQNGPGNYVSPDVLASMAENFSIMVQNSLDNQEISTQNIYDISVDNVSNTIDGIAASQAIEDSLAITY